MTRCEMRKQADKEKQEIAYRCQKCRSLDTANCHSIRCPMRKHGGKRKGAGPKLKYSEPTERIGFRVPISHVNKVKKMVNDYLLLLQSKKPSQ